jgi:hypothetical protein
MPSLVLSGGAKAIAIINQRPGVPRCIRLFTFRRLQMHEYIIESMVEALKPTIRSPRRAKELLKHFWQDKIALVWDTTDVHTAANERELALTKKEAIHVLNELHHNHNKQCGFKWEDVTSYIEEHCLGRKLTKRELKRFIEDNLLVIHQP